MLRIKGLGLQALDGLAGLTKLRDLTLTLSDNMGPAGWQDMAALRAMTRWAILCDKSAHGGPYALAKVWGRAVTRWVGHTWVG